jgi:uncharacterized membrane protein YfcA
VLWLGYEQKEGNRHLARGDHRDRGLSGGRVAVYGTVDFSKGLLIGIPAVAGVVAGTALQQRISERAVARAFIVLLVGSAAILIF